MSEKCETCALDRKHSGICDACNGQDSYIEAGWSVGKRLQIQIDQLITENKQLKEDNAFLHKRLNEWAGEGMRDMGFKKVED